MTRPPQLLIALAGSVLMIACGDGVGATGPTRPDSVLLIAVDGLRADQVGAYTGGGRSTPSLDDLAARGLRYTDVATPAPWTAPALAALLSGRYPSALGWTDLEQALPYEVQLLSERLGARGYSTGAVVNHRFAAASLNLDQGFDAYREVGLPPKESGDEVVLPPSARAVTDATLSLVDAAGARPFFVLAHFADPLPPWGESGAVLDPDYLGPIEPGLSLHDLLRLAPDFDGADRRALIALHDRAVAVVDAQIGRLVEGLELRGRMGDTYVVVVGICGLELGEHGELGAAKRLYDELLYVPWIMTGPRISAAVIQDAASLIDVLPTLMELLGGEAPRPVDGAPILPGLAPPARRLISETDRARSLRAVVDDRWKLIHDKETGTSELYDLLDDPGETRDLARAQPGRVKALEAVLEDWEKSCAAE